MRVHPFFNTVEFRICDVLMTLDETIAITALFQAICAKLYKLRTKNLNFIIYKRQLVNENKWRASRYGLDGNMIDFGKECEVNTRVLIYELLDFIDDVVDDLGSRHEIHYIERMLQHGTGADRQISIYENTQQIREVVNYVNSEFLTGVD